MNILIDFIKTYWTYLIALGSVLAYTYDKAYTLWNDKKKKQTSYNRIFTAVIKLFYSYLKHKKIYAENAPLNLPEEIYLTIAKHLNSFNDDLDEFEKSILKESEIVPEISIQVHMLFDTIDRMRILDKMKLSSEPTLNGFGEKEAMAIKRAQFFAMADVYEEFFTDTIEEIRKYTTVKKTFLRKLFYFTSIEYEKHSEEEQLKIMKKYFESLHRQKILPTEVYEYLMTELVVK